MNNLVRGVIKKSARMATKLLKGKHSNRFFTISLNEGRAGESAGTGRGEFRREYLSEAVMFHVSPMAIKMMCHDVLKTAVSPCKEPKCNR